MYVDPKYGLVAPDAGTSLDELGSEFVQMIQSFSTALENFDYNGADPNTVLAKVAALESSVSSLTGAVDAIKTMTVQRGNQSIALPASKSPNEVNVTFPEAFSALPGISIIPMATLGNVDGMTWRLKSRTTAGFVIEAYAATARTIAFEWSAFGI